MAHSFPKMGRPTRRSASQVRYCLWRICAPIPRVCRVILLVLLAVGALVSAVAWVAWSLTSGHLLVGPGGGGGGGGAPCPPPITPSAPSLRWSSGKWGTARGVSTPPPSITQSPPRCPARPTRIRSGWSRTCSRRCREAQRARRRRATTPRALPACVPPSFPLLTALPQPRVPRFLACGRRGKFSTRPALMHRYGHMDFIYSFVNGTEPSHAYRRLLASNQGCFVAIQSEEKSFYETQRTRAEAGDAPLPAEPPTTPAGCAPFVEKNLAGTGRDLLQRLQGRDGKAVNERDRETDELRHSLRSIEKHIQWHRGRVVVVSPGHHPLWMDNARTFLAGSCGGPAVAALRERGTHVRVTTVHQDAVMPYGMKLTVNSHIIEQHLWRVLNMTPVHVYWNDDYFVNRDVAITDLFNEYGGTIVRTEKATVMDSFPAPIGGISWRDGVAHNNLFNTLELDFRREDYLPLSLQNLWQEEIAPSPLSTTAAAAERASTNEHFCDVARAFRPDDIVPLAHVPGVQQRAVRDRYYATHAPFVYCTNMFRHLSLRYELEYSFNALYHRERKARDFFMPFVYNAFIMARPWVASLKFLPYVDRLHRGKADGAAAGAAAPPTETIYLDNEDGCAPATLLHRDTDANALFIRVSNDIAANKAFFDRVTTANPLFFNINAGFTSPEASQQLLNFLHSKFPDAVYLERGYPAVSAEDAALPGLYAALMRLPVVAVTSFAEGVCPLLRSLQLALPDHAGVVVPVVARDGRGGDADATLAELRAELRHRVRSAMPVVGCAYSERVVRPGAATAAANAGAGAAGWGGGALAGVVAAALGELGAEDAAGGGGVTLPAVCGGAGGGVRIVGIVVDGRSDARGGVRDARWLRRAVTMPGQTLALEDFEVVPVGGDGGGSVLVLSRASAAARAVHWIDGAAESDLLATYPIPHAAYEDLDAPVRLR